MAQIEKAAGTGGGGGGRAGGGGGGGTEGERENAANTRFVNLTLENQVLRTANEIAKNPEYNQHPVYRQRVKNYDRIAELPSTPDGNRAKMWVLTWMDRAINRDAKAVREEMSVDPDRPKDPLLMGRATDIMDNLLKAKEGKFNDVPISPEARAAAGSGTLMLRDKKTGGVIQAKNQQEYQDAIDSGEYESVSGAGSSEEKSRAPAVEERRRRAAGEPLVTPEEIKAAAIAQRERISKERAGQWWLSPDENRAPIKPTNKIGQMKITAYDQNEKKWVEISQEEARRFPKRYVIPAE
jgi:hypothetical protein